MSGPTPHRDMPYGTAPAVVEQSAFKAGPEGADELARAAAALLAHIATVLSEHGRGCPARLAPSSQRPINPTGATHRKRQQADAVTLSVALPARKRSAAALAAPSSTGEFCTA